MWRAARWRALEQRRDNEVRIGAAVGVCLWDVVHGHVTQHERALAKDVRRWRQWRWLVSELLVGSLVGDRSGGWLRWRLLIDAVLPDIEA
jgi:hypothetical protein